MSGYKAEQEMELEALEAILSDDLTGKHNHIVISLVVVRAWEASNVLLQSYSQYFMR